MMMTSNDLELIKAICKRPGMYVPSGTLDGAYAFITGLDVGTGCLTGFREWLVTRFKDGDNLVWWGLMEMLFESESCPEQDKFSRMNQVFEEFFSMVNSDSRHGLMRIYLCYHAWLLNKTYYDEDGSGYIPPYDGIKIPKEK